MEIFHSLGDDLRAGISKCIHGNLIASVETATQVADTRPSSPFKCFCGIKILLTIHPSPQCQAGISLNKLIYTDRAGPPRC